VRLSLAAALAAASAAGLALGVAGAAGTGASDQVAAPAPVVAAYFADFDPTLVPGEIDASHLTDVIYAFGGLDAHGHCTLAEPGLDPSEFSALAALEARYPKLETEISIGGWAGSGAFSTAAATAAGRTALVRSCIDLFLRHSPSVFDGFDIDWEFPVAGGAQTTRVRSSDRAGATLLLAEFRRQLDVLGAVTHRHYLLTIAAPAFGTGGGPGYTPATSWDLAAVAKLLDWFNLMTYDMAQTRSQVTNFESPLYPTPADSRPAPPPHANTIDGAVRFYEAAGVPAEKIVIGAPFYGHVFDGVHSYHAGLFQHFRRLGADPSYAQIAGGDPAGSSRHWSAVAQEPWIYDRRTHTFLSYDDPAAMSAKAHYAVAHHLRGVMLWEIAMDDRAHSLLDALAGPVLAARR
jgi:chitinase